MAPSLSIFELTDRFLQQMIATQGGGLLAMDESNTTCGKLLDAIGVENTDDNRRAYLELLVTTPGLSQYFSGSSAPSSRRPVPDHPGRLKVC